MAASKRTATKAARATAGRQRAIQAAAEDHDERKAPGKDGTQPSTRRTGKSKGGQPPQHQHKPGSEQLLDPRPQFLAPTYAGSGKLAGMTPLNPAYQPAERMRDFGKSSAMGRPAQPEELAPAYVFLAAPCCASYISGAVLPVMGGPTS